MSNYSIERHNATLQHLATRGLVFDGDLISKTIRDELVEYGYVWQYGGFNFLTLDGARAAVHLGLAKT